jgi:hypothetical protein
MSEFDVISALEGFVKTRDNRVRGAVGIVERLVIIYGLIKRI